MLDSLILVILLPFLLFCSGVLTACLLALCAFTALWLVVMLPSVRRRVGAMTSAEIRKSNFLTETLYGIRAIKSLALDARQRHEWGARVAMRK